MRDVAIGSITGVPFKVPIPGNLDLLEKLLDPTKMPLREKPVRQDSREKFEIRTDGLLMCKLDNFFDVVHPHGRLASGENDFEFPGAKFLSAGNEPLNCGEGRFNRHVAAVSQSIHAAIFTSKIATRGYVEPQPDPSRIVDEAPILDERRYVRRICCRGDPRRVDLVQTYLSFVKGDVPGKWRIHESVQLIRHDVDFLPKKFLVHLIPPGGASMSAVPSFEPHLM